MDFKDFDIDYRYVCGRDNYTCQGCFKELEQPLFASVHLDDEWVTSNVVLTCSRCLVEKKPETYKTPLREFRGRLLVIVGSMYASKSTTTKAFYDKYSVVHQECVWVKPDRDDRSDGFTTTHNKEKIEAYTINAKRPDQYLNVLKNYKVIVFDEAQFFSDRLLYLIHQLLQCGCLVIANGLKLTVKRSLFGVVHYLLAEADEIISLKAICNKCGSIDTATRTKSYQNLPSVKTGGKDDYYAVCPACDGDEDANEIFKKPV